MSDIIDNQDTSLADVAKGAFAQSKSSDIATGYFFLPGLTPFAEELTNLKEIRLLIGQTTDQRTVDALAYAIPDDTERSQKHQIYENKRDAD